jgi:hypothetical protein
VMTLSLQDEAVATTAIVVLEQQSCAQGLHCSAPSAVQGPVRGRGCRSQYQTADPPLLLPPPFPPTLLPPLFLSLSEHGVSSQLGGGSN